MKRGLGWTIHIADFDAVRRLAQYNFWAKLTVQQDSALYFLVRYQFCRSWLISCPIKPLNQCGEISFSPWVWIVLHGLHFTEFGCFYGVFSAYIQNEKVILLNRIVCVCLCPLLCVVTLGLFPFSCIVLPKRAYVCQSHL